MSPAPTNQKTLLRRGWNDRSSSNDSSMSVKGGYESTALVENPTSERNLPRRLREFPLSEEFSFSSYSLNAATRFDIKCSKSNDSAKPPQHPWQQIRKGRYAHDVGIFDEKTADLLSVDVATMRHDWGYADNDYFMEMSAASASPDWGDSIPDGLKEEWDKFWHRMTYEFWAYKPFENNPRATLVGNWTYIGGYRVGFDGYIFGDRRFYYEVGIRNVTMWDIAIFAISLSLGLSQKLGFFIAKGVEWFADWLVDDEKNMKCLAVFCLH